MTLRRDGAWLFSSYRVLHEKKKKEDFIDSVVATEKEVVNNSYFQLLFQNNIFHPDVERSSLARSNHRGEENLL